MSMSTGMADTYLSAITLPPYLSRSNRKLVVNLLMAAMVAAYSNGVGIRENINS